MRSLCTFLSVAVLAGPLMFLASGCGGGTSEIEKPPADVKPGTLSTDNMPGYKEMQNTVKKGNTK